MKYKGYEAVIEYDEVDSLFFGKVINTRDVISLEINIFILSKSYPVTFDFSLFHISAKLYIAKSRSI